MTKNKSLEDLLLEKFNVYYSEYDGQYHNGRQADGTEPFQEAKEEILQSLLSLIGSDEQIEGNDGFGNTVMFDSPFNEYKAELRTKVREWVNK